MTIAPGQQLLHYRLAEKIGEGGMGEVWKALDTTLDREVAIKVLPQAFAQDAERLTRFEREAKFLASLNHANIATIHGLHRAEGLNFLAMEHVPGEDLAQRLARGPLAVDTALEVARGIAEALEAAHEQGVVHRDLKPANVKLGPGGKVKVLDFGLAKALAPDAASTERNLSLSPTLTSAGTVAGVILGTAAYMSPEQARGQPVDKRADIFAFGCVLYEMLTAKRAFGGETVSDTLASILKETPDLAALPAEAGRGLRRVLARTLEKDPRRRYRDIGDVRLDLERSALDDAAGESAAPAPVARRGGSRLAWGAAAVLAVALLATVIDEEQAPPPLLRAEIAPPAGHRFNLTGDYAGPPVPAPDGTKIAFVAVGPDGQGRLYVRALEGLTANVVDGTEGAYFPFWSPDSRSLGFFTGLTLKRVDLDGSPPLTLVPAGSVGQGKGGTWSRDGVIVFAPESQAELLAIPDTGGEARTVTTLDQARHTTHRWPQFLDDGRHFIYLAANHADPAGPEGAIWLGSLDGGEAQRIVPASAGALIAAGRMLYLQGETLMARRLDPHRPQADEPAQRLLEEVQVDRTTWKLELGASDTLLAYVPRGAGRGMELQWFDRSGEVLGSLGPPANYQNIELSPDGRRVAAELQATGPNSDIWVMDVAGQSQVRLTFAPQDEAGSRWTPDGEFLYYSKGDDHYRILRKRANGAGEEEPVYSGQGQHMPLDWSPDGRYLLIATLEEATNVARSSLAVWTPQGEVYPLELGSEARTTGAQFSPDGRFIAYTSDLSGQPEVYAAAFIAPAGGAAPRVAGKWQVSTEGGSGPRWRGDGRELYYFREDNTIMAVPVRGAGEALEIGRAEPLFRVMRRADTVAYDVTADGQRFLISSLGPEAARPLAVTRNWTRQLEAR